VSAVNDALFPLERELERLADDPFGRRVALRKALQETWQDGWKQGYSDRGRDTAEAAFTREGR